MTNTLIERHGALTENINTLKAERSQIGKELRSAAIEADEQTKADLEAKLNEARQAAKALSDALAAAEATKAALDKRIDSGDESVTPLEVVEADMAVRTTKGKLHKDAEPALRKAERALTPFLSDNHLALHAADVIEPLVDVPVLVRKRPGDVQGISDAVVLSQAEPTNGYGTVDVSGMVGVTLLGSTGYDVEAVRVALEDTGSEVSVTNGLIDYHNALWPLPRLHAPSEHAVVQFANALHQTFDAQLKRGRREGREGMSSWVYYDARWHTLEASLDVIEDGKAKGKVVAIFGVEDERPPLSQMQQIIKSALGHFHTGVHTSAGVLDNIALVEVADRGPWVASDEPLIASRLYTQKFGLTIDLDFSYEPVEVSR